MSAGAAVAARRLKVLPLLLAVAALTQLALHEPGGQQPAVILMIVRRYRRRRAPAGGLGA